MSTPHLKNHRCFLQTLKLLRCPGSMKSHNTSESADAHKTGKAQFCLLWRQMVTNKTLKCLPPTHHFYQTASYFPITSEYIYYRGLVKTSHYTFSKSLRLLYQNISQVLLSLTDALQISVMKLLIL